MRAEASILAARTTPRVVLAGHWLRSAADAHRLRHTEDLPQYRWATVQHRWVARTVELLLMDEHAERMMLEEPL